MNVRLDKFLSSQTDLTRTDIKKLLWKRKISVNGKILRDGSIKIDPETSEIIADGRKIVYRDKVYIILNKPEGFVCATEDKHEKTVMDLLGDDIKRKDIFPAGRLDKDTVGFVLVTDDGDFAHRMLSPKKHVSKTYEAIISDAVSPEDISAFQEGLQLKDGTLCLRAELKVLEPGKQPLVQIVIHEGKYHQIKRMFEARGKKVLFLKRTKIGNLS